MSAKETVIVFIRNPSRCLWPGLILVFVLILSGPVRADRQVDLGLKIGINIPTLYSGGDTIYSSYGYYHSGNNIGPNFPFLRGVYGLFCAVSMTEYFSFQGELLLSGKGKESIGPDIKIDYIEFPVLAKLYLSPARVFCLMGGPTVAWAFKGTMPLEDVSANPYYLTRIYRQVEIENLRKLDWGLALGLAVNFGFGRGNMSFEIRYTAGLRDIATATPVEKQSPDNAYLEPSKNSVISILFNLSVPVL